MSYRPYAAIISEAISSNSKLFSSMKNSSGSTILALQPVCSDSFGDIKAVDISQDSDAIKILGLAIAAIPDTTSGDVITSGRLLAVSTSFSQGDFLYVSKAGLLTNIAPSEGVDSFVSGDFVIRVGIVVKNAITPSNKDIIINVQIMGKL